jgi:cellulose synthase/poly-beta-1,6-N-acetylglucosamine synthase-like glycosyltransferase
MIIVISVFIFLSTVVWFSTIGYALLLKMLRTPGSPLAWTPPTSPAKITVVIPTLNEAPAIDRKLANIRKADYPFDRMEVLVVDGGSDDTTIERMQRQITQGEPIRLIMMSGKPGKAAQVNRALEETNGDIIVVTDADSEWEPSCIARLAAHLAANPDTGVISAVVRPRTCLGEERLHWALLNWIWWLEGEAWSAPGLSGVCYAMRRSVFRKLSVSVQAEDIHLALNVAADGHRVRLCPQAVVWELRVPQTLREYLQFRLRRGSRYLEALRHQADIVSRRSPRARLTPRIRQWQMAYLPILALLTGILGVILLASPYWPWPLGVITAMFFSAAPLVWEAHRLMGTEASGPDLKWLWSVMRWLSLTLVSLLCLPLQKTLKGVSP